MVDQQLVLDFVNTWHRLEADDALTTPDALAGWLRERDLLSGAAISPAELREAKEVREALRTLLLANNDVDVDTAPAVELLDRAARRARLEPSFGRAALVPAAGGAAGAVGRLLAVAHAAMADGSWPRLKACRARDCEWAFADHARNHSRAWCSMRVCGNREKVRSYRERHQSTS